MKLLVQNKHKRKGNRMKVEQRNFYDQIQKQYWKRIPKERVDEAVLACKEKHAKSTYVFSVIVLVVFTGIGILEAWPTSDASDGFWDLVCSIMLFILNAGFGLFPIWCLWGEPKIVEHKIKSGKAWIKSGQALEYRVGNYSRKPGSRSVAVLFLCQEGQNQVIYEKLFLYKNSHKIIPDQDMITVVVVGGYFIILDQYYPEYAGDEGTCNILNNPEMIWKMESYGYVMEYYDICQEIWEKYVPENGKSKALQGELLRLAELLRSSAKDKNKNWDTECEDACDFLEYYFVYDEENGVSDKNKMLQIISCIRERGRNKEAYENLVLFDYMEDKIAAIYLENKDANDYHYHADRREYLLRKEKMKTLETIPTSRKRKEKIVWGIVAVTISVLFVFLVGRVILDNQKAKKEHTGIMLDVPVVQVDGNDLQLGEKLDDIYGYDYTFMTEDFDMYYSRDFIQTMAAPGESMQFYMVTEENTRKNLLCPFKKTGIKITVTNIGERTDTLFLGRITKIVINERENSDEHVLMLDGIETQNLDRNTAVEELQQTGVKFKEEEVQKFVNGKIDRLVSDSANYRYIIKASQDDKQVILEVESLE